MYYSNYNYQFASKSYGYLIFNGLTRSFARLNKELHELLLQIKTNPENISKLDSETKNRLQHAKILVNKTQEEDHFYMKRMSWYNHIFKNDIMALTIAPTSSCNFGCPYCFEQGIKSKTMNDEVIEHLIGFVKDHMPLRDLKITWYGGEPLLQVKIIKKIQQKIKSQNLPLSGEGMITNGYFLNKANQNWIIENHFHSLQITLDGPREIHDQRRFLKNNSKKSTWDVIISNIDEFINKKHNVKISIRCNIDHENLKLFDTLKEQLLNRWSNDKRIYIYPSVVYNYNEKDRNKCSLMNLDELALFKLEQAQNNKNKIYPRFNTHNCGLMNINSYVVGPKGELYKCWNDLGLDNKIVGSIITPNKLNIKWLSRYMAGPGMLDDKKCKKCPLFFLCMGGCQYNRLENKYNNKNQPLCTYYKNHFDKFLELHYEQKLQENIEKTN